jgi:hypothetical protein
MSKRLSEICGLYLCFWRPGGNLPGRSSLNPALNFHYSNVVSFLKGSHKLLLLLLFTPEIRLFIANGQYLKAVTNKMTDGFLFDLVAFLTV